MTSFGLLIISYQFTFIFLIGFHLLLSSSLRHWLVQSCSHYASCSYVHHLACPISGLSSSASTGFCTFLLFSSSSTGFNSLYSTTISKQNEDESSTIDWVSWVNCQRQSELPKRRKISRCSTKASIVHEFLLISTTTQYIWSNLSKTN